LKQRKPPDWLIQERRDTLGHWSAFCVHCGFAQRYFEELEHELPPSCPECGGAFLARCPACEARFASAFAVDCELCGESVRAPDLFGVPIRRADQ
jgi:hypothetical protein